ncbi:MAG TPA: mechanosensitive ion channel family protein [Acidimicrobiales bacterium]|nr:mechanosensitive ion channel family protein [Acidimicrobiales bacterium]
MIDFTGVVLAVAEDADEELEQALQGLDTGDWITAVAILVGSIVVARLVQRLVRRLVQRGEGGSQAARLVGRLFAALVMAVGLVYALQTLGVRLAPLLGALGIGGLALAFAAQSILENLFASVLLQSRRPFRLGDQIATNEIEGTVEDVNFRTVVLRTYAGEKVLIPCSQVLNTPITNFTAKGTRRTTLEVGVAYGTDLATAQQVLLRAATSVGGVQSQPAPEAWVEEFAESSINFALRWWHSPDIATMWRVRSGVAMAVKVAFDESGIQIPFPQRTLGFLPGVELGVNVAGGDDGDAESHPV